MASRLERPGPLSPVPRPRDWPRLKLEEAAALSVDEIGRVFDCNGRGGLITGCGDTSAFWFSSEILPLPVNAWPSPDWADGKDCTRGNCCFFVTKFSFGVSVMKGELVKSWGLKPKSFSVCSKLNFLGCCAAAVVTGCCCCCWDLNPVCVLTGEGSVRGLVLAWVSLPCAPVWMFAASWNWPGDSTESAGSLGSDSWFVLAPENLSLFLLSLWIRFLFLFGTTLIFGDDDRDGGVACCWLRETGGSFLTFFTLTLLRIKICWNDADDEMIS